MIKRLIAPLAVCLLALGVVFLAPTPEVFADSKSEICKGVNAAAGATGCPDGRSDLNRIIKTVLDLFSLIIGIIAVIMIMVGGFKYVTAGGDSSKITSAKHTIIYALIGIIVVALAQTIVRFVLEKTTAP